MIDRETVETPEATRIEVLLRDAASFVPEHAAPDDLCSRALCKTATVAPLRTRRFALLAVGGGAAAALAAFSVACVLNVVSRPRIAPNQVGSIHQDVTSPTVDAVTPLAHEQAAPETVVAHTVVAYREPIRFRRVRHRRFATHRELASSRTSDIVIPPSPRHEERPQVVTVTAQPAAAARSCWTTEDVQETKYVLVSPGIVTDGSGDSERATPVLVQLPISSDDEASYGDEPATPTETTTH